MKKFYALAAAAVAAVAVNAGTLYVVGGYNGGDYWDPANPMEVTEAEGAYTFDLDDLVSFKVSTAMGDWDTFNGGAVCADITEEALGVPVALAPADGNIEAPWKGNYHIVIAGDLSTITMTTTTPKPVGFADVYLRGNMTGWGADDAFKFTTTDGKVYTFVCQGATALAADADFKVADANWGSINYGASGVVTFDQEMSWNYNANNCKVPGEFVGTITFTLPDVPKGPATVLFDTTNTGSVEAIAVEENAVAEYFNLQGVRVANPTAGMYIVRQGGKVSKQLVK